MPDLHALDLFDLAESVPRSDEQARERAAVLVSGAGWPHGALGRLGELAGFVAATQGRCPPQPYGRVRAVVFAGDHGIAAAGVSRLSAASPGATTANLVRELLDGRGPGAACARAAGATVRVVDVAVDDPMTDVPDLVTAAKITRGSGRLDQVDALTPEQARAAFEAGMAVADQEADSGTDLVALGDLGIGASTPAAVLVGVLTGTEVAVVVGQGRGLDDQAWMRKAAAVRDGMRRGRPVLGDPLALLAMVGGADLAAATGFLLRSAARRTPVVLDGVVGLSCALLAHRIAFRGREWWLAGQRSGDPAADIAMERLALHPVLDVAVGLGQATGALLAVPLLQAAV
ncbi:MAG: nicotinate-nucleotide--dimethylbenzimidazole phosphoribosyltransferase, partial [Actinomycetes bacterium]